MPATDLAGLAQTTQFAGSNGYGLFSLSPSGEWSYKLLAAAHANWVAGQRYSDSLRLTTPQGVVKTIMVEMAAEASLSVWAPLPLWEPRPRGDGLAILLGTTVTAQLPAWTWSGTSAASAPRGAAAGVALSALTATLHSSDGVAPKGVAITALDSHVQLWWSADSGAHWQSLQAADLAGHALLLQDDGATRLALTPLEGTSTAAIGLAQALSFRAWSGLDALGQPASQGVLVAAPVQTGVGTAFGSLLNSATWVVTGAVKVSDVHLLQDTGVVGDGITSNPALSAPSQAAWGVNVDYRWQKDGGTWSAWSSSYTPPPSNGSADGPYTVQVRQSNVAGETATQTLGFVLDSQVALPALASNSGSITGRYIRIYHNDNALTQSVLALTGLKVMSGGVDVAASLLAAATANNTLTGPIIYGADAGTPTNAAWTASALVDGIYGNAWYGIGGTNTTAGGTGVSGLAYLSGGSKPYIQVDLGAVYAIDSLMLWGRHSPDTLGQSDQLRVFVSSTAPVTGATAYATLTGSTAYQDVVSTAVAATKAGTTDSTSGTALAYLGGTTVANPLLSGTGEAGATVDIFDTAAVVTTAGPTQNLSGKIGSALVNSSGTWRFQASSITSGSHSITTQQTDVAGNKSGLSSAYTFTVASTAMGLPALDAGGDSGMQGDGMTNNTLPTLTGTAVTANGAVEIYDNGSKIATVNATGNTWTYTPTRSLSSGVHSITAKDVSANAGAGKTSGALALNIDISAAAPSINTPTASNTNVAPVISGTGAEAGALITITATPTDGGSVQTFYALANASGAWSQDTSSAGSALFNGSRYTSRALVANKTYILRATQTDVSGNVSGVSSAQVLNFDTEALTPVLNAPNTSASQTLSGTGEAGATVRVYDTTASGIGSVGTATVGTATVGANGTWSLNVIGLSSGSHSFRVEQTDSVGNLSSQSAAQAVSIDTRKPTAPVLAATTVVNNVTVITDSGIAGDGITNVQTPSLSGTGTANTAVEVWDTCNGIETRVGSTTTNASGVWSIANTSTTLAQGQHSLVVKEIKADGTVNSLRVSDATTLTIDTTASNAPTLTLNAASDSGTQGDGITNVTTPTVSGMADAGAWVTVYKAGSTVLGTVQAQGSAGPNPGAWSLKLPALVDDVAAITAKQTDTAGNESAASTALSVTVDSTVAAPALISNAGGTTGRFIRIYHTDAQAGAVALSGLKVFANGLNVMPSDSNMITAGTDTGGVYLAAFNAGTLASGDTGYGGIWTGVSSQTSTNNVAYVDTSGGVKPYIQVDLGQAYNIDSVMLWGALMGNSGAVSQNLRVFTSTTLPVTGATAYATLSSTTSYTDMATVTTAQDAAGAAGTELSIAGLTATPGASPLLAGNGEPGALVDIFDSASTNADKKLGSTTVNGNGTWLFQATGITSGSHSITTQQTDVAGNKSGLSSAYTFTVNSTAMGQPALDASSDSGIWGDTTTNVVTPTLKGTALSAGNGSNLVQVFDNGVLLGSAIVQSDKTWRFTPGSSLGDGAHNITVKDVMADKTSVGWMLNIDMACTAPTFNAVADTRTAPVITGTGEAGGTIMLMVIPTDGTATVSYNVQVAGNGSWSVDTGIAQGSSVLVPGKSYTLFVTATDVAGNTARAAAVGHVLYDNAMDAQLQRMDWRMDLGMVGEKGQLGAGDVLRLTFDQAVGLTAGSLPTAVFGTGAVLAAVEPVAGKSRFWDVKLGSGQTLGALNAGGVGGTALSQSWALAGVSDALGNGGTVTVAAGSQAALTVQVQAQQAPTWQVGMSDVEDKGTVIQGWAAPGAKLRMNWGGQETKDFTADAQGYWTYTFYKNESYFGRKVPQLNADQTLSLLQVNADTTTTTLWTQTAQVQSTPEDAPMALPAGATARPLSVQLAVRAGRSVALDVRDATQDMQAGNWQVKVSGLAPYQSLNHGSRDSAGVWTVDAQDWADLRINTTTNTVQEVDRVLQLSYQQNQGSGGSATWLTQRQASVGLSVVPWVQLPTGASIEDWAGFTQVQRAWNVGLKGLSGAGINIGIHEGAAVDVNRISNFEPGNVLVDTFTGENSASHAHGVGLRAAGSINGPFVGGAYGANIKWTSTPQGMDVTNWSVGLGASHITSQWGDVDVTQRNGLGNVMVISSGNEGVDMTALLTTTKSPVGITVGSIDNASGERSGFSNYGEGLWVTHPGNGGTSHAAPGVSGQVALMLEANPGLGTRDVKNILALGATYYTTATPLKGFELNQARVLNGAGAHFSNEIGFGVSNAFNAVRLAADWLADGSAPQTMSNWSRNSATVATTPVTVASAARQVTQVRVTVTDDVKLEALQVFNTISIDSFSNMRKMRMVVTSPSGTVSELVNGTTVGSYNGYLLMTSNKFFGESSLGTWTISYEFNADATSPATVSHVGLGLFGSLNTMADKYVYTDQFGLHWQLAGAATRAQMGWLTDLNGGNDSLMLSAMSTDVQVHLGRHGWMTSPSFRVLMAPGTQIENAFGGDGNDVLVGLRDGKSILRGNEGNDLLLAYGAGSTLDGGNADDWLWLGGDTSAVGGQGNDRFVVFQGETKLGNTAAVRAQISDFDATQDSLMSYDTAGNFKLAQFDSAGALTGWAAVTNTSLLQTLRGQLAQSDAPDVLGVTVSGTASAPTLTLTWDQSPVNGVDGGVGNTASSYAAWTLNGAAPASASLAGSSLSLGYSGVVADAVQGSGVSAGVSVLDTSGAQLYSTLGMKMPYQKIYVGSTGADTVDASGQSAAVALLGQGGNDVLTGGAGADLLVATGMTSASAQVRMTGGQGADVFRLDVGSSGSGSASGRLQVSDFNLSQGDRLDLDALLQTIGSTNFVEDCVQITRTGNDAVLAFDLSGQKAFATSAFTVLLDNVYTQTTDINLRTLTYGSGMSGVLG